MNTTSVIQGRLMLVTAAVGWSLSGAIIKSADLSALSIAFGRSLVAALCLAPLAWRRRQPLDWGNLWLALAYTGSVTLLVAATKATTAANAILLQYTAPVFVFLLGLPLLGERPGWGDWVGLVLTMAGVGWIFAGAGEADSLGVMLGLASGLSFGMLILLQRRYRHKDPFWVLGVNNAVVALLLLPWLEPEPASTVGDLGLMVVMGVVQLGIPYLLFFMALQRVPAREGALITLLEPLLNPVWVALAVGELPGLSTQAGGAIVLLGVVARYALAAGERLSGTRD
ncbi:MAG: DMT family transporter [Candidatus Handelsmanbacteria bacterium]|nr:DMT family transporter [Candidatus Handelsmanbacteria bacterium]